MDCQLNKGRLFTNHSPRVFKDVFERWQKINIQFADAWRKEKDVPWWYNERALLSLLSSAVWLEGGKALEEYSKDKVVKARKGKKKRSRGRQDIYISLHGHQFIGECKICWSTFAPNKENSIKPLPRIKRAWDRAVEDTHLTLKERKRKLAILFIRPAVNIKKGRVSDKTVTKLLREWHKAVEEFVRGIDGACCAWIYPPGYRRCSSGDGYFCPGIMLVIAEYGW